MVINIISLSIIKQNISFFMPYLILLVIGLVINILYSQNEIFLYINRFYSTPSDTFFRYYTNVGDGAFLLCVVAILCFIRFRYAIIFFLAWAMEGLTVQFLKQIIFPNHARPWEVMRENKAIRLVPDVQAYISNSFPSGHSGTAFCMFLLFAIFSKSQGLKFVCLLLALLVAYSRIYLCQHFFLDVYVGSVIGVLSSMFVYVFFLNHFEHNAWMNKSLLNLKTKTA